MFSGQADRTGGGWGAQDRDKKMCAQMKGQGNYGRRSASQGAPYKRTELQDTAVHFRRNWSEDTKSEYLGSQNSLQANPDLGPESGKPGSGL